MVLWSGAVSPDRHCVCGDTHSRDAVALYGCKACNHSRRQLSGPFCKLHALPAIFLHTSKANRPRRADSVGAHDKLIWVILHIIHWTSFSLPGVVSGDGGDWGVQSVESGNRSEDWE